MTSRQPGTAIVTDTMPAYPRLLVDLGGTYSRLLWQWDKQREEPPVRVENEAYPDPAMLLQAFIDAHAPPAGVALALAAPVNSEVIHFTNRPDWAISPAKLSAMLGGVPVEILNDFTALALAIPYRDPGKCIQIGTGEAAADAALAVLGPGTGFGVSGLIPAGDEWVPVCGEGGHVTLPATNAAEFELFRSCAGTDGHVSAERLLSGPGLLRLYDYYREPSNEILTQPQDLVRQASEGVPAAQQALATFFALLGTVAGDIALTLGARGGVYLGGGILPQLSEALQNSEFRNRFVAKGRYRDYLEAIPTYLISDPFLSLRGLAAWLDRKS